MDQRTAATVIDRLAATTTARRSSWMPGELRDAAGEGGEE